MNCIDVACYLHAHVCVKVVALARYTIVLEDSTALPSRDDVGAA